MNVSDAAPERPASLTEDLDREIARLEGELAGSASSSGYIIASAKLEALRKLRFSEAPFYRTYE